MLSTAVTPAPTPATIVPYGGGIIGETILVTLGTIFLIAFQAEVKKPLILAQNLEAYNGTSIGAIGTIGTSQEADLWTPLPVFSTHCVSNFNAKFAKNIVNLSASDIETCLVVTDTP